MSKKTREAADITQRSWLVQRLKKPYGGSGPLATLGEAFSFGGGMVNGGLSGEAMGLLRQVFAFDYMGSAEFEWGAVPKALNGLAKDADELIAYKSSIPLSAVPANWRDKSRDVPTGFGTVYVLCRTRQSAVVDSRILGWATGDRDFRTKEHVGLDHALRPFGDYDPGVCGWLELDNGFFFFTDEQMWAQTAALFGVTTDAAVTA